MKSMITLFFFSNKTHNFFDLSSHFKILDEQDKKVDINFSLSKRYVFSNRFKSKYHKVYISSYKWKDGRITSSTL